MRLMDCADQNELTASQRRIAVLVTEGLTNQEAADVMGISLKALQSLIMRAKATLKERMTNQR